MQYAWRTLKPTCMFKPKIGAISPSLKIRYQTKYKNLITVTIIVTPLLPPTLSPLEAGSRLYIQYIRAKTVAPPGGMLNCE